MIVARENDKILFEVKDKFARTKPSINRFLGRILVDINTLIEKASQTKGFVTIQAKNTKISKIKLYIYSCKTTSKTTDIMFLYENG